MDENMRALAAAESGELRAAETEASLCRERIELAMERIRLIPEDRGVPDPFHGFFCDVAQYLLQFAALRDSLHSGCYRTKSLAEMQAIQSGLYRDMLPENYPSSWLNPACAALRCRSAEEDAQRGDPEGTRRQEAMENATRLGQLLSALYAELYALLPLCYADREADMAPILELFLQCYGLFTAGEIPKSETLRNVLYWYAFDYLDVTVPERTEALLEPEESVQASLYHGFSREDLRYLFFSGDYVSESCLKTAEFLNSLPEEELQLAAETFTEGFAEGFRAMGRALQNKSTVAIRYLRGFERLVEREAELFAAQGLRTILPPPASRLTERIPGRGARMQSLSPNRQFDYDHRFDAAIFWDKAFTDRKLTELRAAYEARREAARRYAGPAVMEYFGEESFEPLRCTDALAFTEKQRRLLNLYMAELSEITEQYMPGDETSFTIIAWPLPEIGKFFPALFRDIVRINTLDNAHWRILQQQLIDLLDRCDYAEIVGTRRNETSLRIALRELRDPEKETRFENCVSDVNIPAGEVFTSPVLKGTEGLLHVSEVYIDGLLFKDLRIRVADGQTTELSCGNFSDPEENRRFVVENIMGNHASLPMGEFAIGTNTLAAAVAARYGIERQMPILIAEKTGPHFAFGDTCYSHEEDTMTYNPDGKAIIARDNEISARRHDCPAEAYFNHHKDITIPYAEIGRLSAVMQDGGSVDIIRDGRFVLPGLSELNEPLQELLYGGQRD